MKFLSKYPKFFESSQSKKIKKYFTYSVALDWYRDNKGLIAKTLGCTVTDLADEEALMIQSYGLVNFVINTQSTGNTGRKDIDISGFSSFNKIENNLIHDILHNIYQVKRKEFNKSLQDLQFTESEILEEIEVLGIEESFMKYMNITYVKTDFINQNINMLASYLMMTILKNNPERIKKILDKEIEPYLEIYYKEYPTIDSPFENFFDLFDNRAADSSFRIDDSEDLKNYMIKLINVGYGIDNTGGDRAQYPSGDYYGLESWYDISDYDRKSFIEDNFERKRYSGRQYYLIDGDKSLGISELDFDYTITNVKSKFKNREELKSIPIRKEFIEDDIIDVNAWLSYLKELLDIDIYEVDNSKFLGIEYNGKTKLYTILNDEEFEDYIRDYFADNADCSVDTNKEFIDFEHYKEFPFEKVVEILMNNDNSMAIMRRNFRVNDVIKSNTKIGKLDYKYSYTANNEIKTKNIAHRYIDFEGSDFASEKSISKIILTDNGKKLKLLLDNLRGYVIKNLPKIKADHKKNQQKFKKKDLEQYRKIDLNELKALLNTLATIDFNAGLELKFELNYGYTSQSMNGLKLMPSDQLNAIMEFADTFKNMIRIKELVKTKRDVDFLKNYVTDNGLLRTKDFSTFRGLVTKISKYSALINAYKYKGVIDGLNNSLVIKGTYSAPK